MSNYQKILLGVTLPLVLACAGGEAAGAGKTIKAKVKAVTPPDAVTLMYILAGQSNASGCAWKKDLTDKQKGYFYNSLMYIRGDRTSPGWVQCQPGLGYTYNQIGPELGFTYNVAGQPVRIIKYTVHGTALQDFWMPGCTGYVELLTTIQEAVASAPEGCEIAGMLWMQGENDANNNIYATNYQSNWTTFITQLRSDLNFPDMSVVMGKIYTTWPYSVEVRAAQDAIAAADPLVTLVETSDLKMMTGANHHHYNTPSQLMLGKRFALAASEW